MTLTPAGISTSVHYKPTDSHSYLHYSSHHPQKCKDGIPFARDPELGSLFDHNIITAYCNPPNLSNFLVRSKIQEYEIGGTFSCGHNRCVTCNHILNTDNISGPTGSFRINKTFTCTSKGVVYAITCLKCGELYIGETGRMLKTRFREHLSYIRTKKADNELSLHFNGPGHSIDDVAVSGLFFESETNRRRLMESKIITRLHRV